MRRPHKQCAIHGRPVTAGPIFLRINMFDPAGTVTLGQIISSLKDLGFIVGTCILGWKARSLVQPAIDFFKRAQTHMETMENGVGALQTGMNTLLNNHLSHMESDLKLLSGRHTDHVIALVDNADPLLEK
jgi:hypothetical protein